METLAFAFMRSVDESQSACIPVNGLVLQFLVLLVIDEKRRWTKSTHFYPRYRWQEHVSNKRVLDWGKKRQSPLVRERQLRFYGHRACFPVCDPANRILAARETAGATKGRPAYEWTITMKNPKTWRSNDVPSVVSKRHVLHTWLNENGVIKCVLLSIMHMKQFINLIIQ